MRRVLACWCAWLCTCLPAQALDHALGLTVAPHNGREDGLVAFVDVVADRLADEVAGDGVAGEAVVLELGPLVVDVFLARGGGIDVEVVAPAGEFHAFVAHGFDLGQELGDLEVGPLAGGQSGEAGSGVHAGMIRPPAARLARRVRASPGGGWV